MNGPRKAARGSARKAQGEAEVRTPAIDLDALREDALRHLGWKNLCAELCKGLRTPVGRGRWADGHGRPEDLRRATVAPRARSKRLAELRLLYDAQRELRARLESDDELDREAWQEIRSGLRHVIGLEESAEALRGGALADPLELLASSELLALWEQLDRSLARSSDEELTGFDREPLAPPEDGPAESAEPALLRCVALPAWSDEASELWRELDRCVELAPEGEGEPSARLRDDASPELARARSAVARESRRRSDLARSLVSPDSEWASSLAESFWTERNGRAVLPFAPQSLGSSSEAMVVIQERSQSGRTVFAEPPELVRANNALSRARADLREAELAVLRALSDALRPHLDALLLSEAAVQRLDFLWARLEFGDRIAGHIPVLARSRRGAKLDLRRLRHAGMVLDGVDVVANDLRLRLGEALVISGPNAGGKTVTLKALGQCVLLSRAGAPIPAGEGSRLPLFSRLVTDLGDDQSVAANLSTFSAQILHVRRALELAKPGRGRGDKGEGLLALFDELGAGTDPAQGAALAQAVLLSLCESGATSLCTTHYEALKVEAANRDSPLQNASVGFELEELRPTFRLHLGRPGSSSAFAVGRRLGLSSDLLKSAEAKLDPASRRLEAALIEAEARAEALEGELKATRQERESLRRSLKGAEARERRVLEGERSRKAKAIERAREEIEDLALEVRRTRKQWRRQGGDPNELPTAAELTAGAREKLAEHQEKPSSRAQAASSMPDREPPVWRVGQRVRVRKSGLIGEVQSVDRGRIELSMGAFGGRFRAEELEAAPPALDRSSKSTSHMGRRSSAASEPGSGADPDPPSRYFGEGARVLKAGMDQELDLRGLRVEESLGQLEDGLARIYASGRALALVRHGHGSGALRQALREHLRRLNWVRQFRAGLPPEGGEGCTVVWMST